MKYYLLNKEEVRKNIWANPRIMKTKSYSKIKQLRSLLSKIEKLKASIVKELKESNGFISYLEDKDAFINSFLENCGDEVTSSEYTNLKMLSLYDRQEQRIQVLNKTNILKGKLVGDEIILDNPKYKVNND
jgi:hypothetical protein